MPQTARMAKLIGHMLAMKREIHERLGKRNFSLNPSTLPRLILLGYVRERDEPSMKEIASFLRITPPSTTALTNSLVAAKFLERKHDPDDRRCIRLRLTPKGKTFIEQQFAEVEKEMSLVLERLTPKEQDQMIGLFEKILL